MAALPTPKAMVKEGPPLFCKGPSLSCELVTVADPFRVPLVIKLLVDDVGWVPAKSPPVVLLAMMVFAILRVPLLKMPPPIPARKIPLKLVIVEVFVNEDELLAIVELEIEREPVKILIPAPLPA